MNYIIHGCNKPGQARLFTSVSLPIQSTRIIPVMETGKGKTAITLRENVNFGNSVTNERIS